MPAKETLLEKINRQPVISWIVLISAMAGLGAAIKDLLSGSSSEEKFYSWLVIFVILGLIAFYGYKEHKRKPKVAPLKHGKYFYGILPDGAETLDETDKKAPLVWSRPKEEKEIRDKIIASVDGAGDYLVLVGQSGMGKSTIIKKRVALELGTNWRVLSFDEYGDDFCAQFCDKLIEKCPEANFDRSRIQKNGKVEGGVIKGCLLIFFDQFEQFLLHAEKTSKKKAPGETVANKASDLVWFASIMSSLHQHPSIVPLIAIRREWFDSLHFLEELVPSPLNVLRLRGIGTQDGVYEEVEQKLTLATGSPKLAKSILADLGGSGEIQPVQVQIVGQMIENELGGEEILTEEKYRHEWHGNDGLLKKYLTISLEAAPDEETAAEIIFALSAEKSHRHPLTIPEICLITHKSKTKVDVAIDYFLKLGLVRKTGTAKVELSHDYLADEFYTFSGSNLPAVSRDNILFFWHAATSGREFDKPVIPDNEKQSVVFSDVVLYGLVTLLFVRLFAPYIAPKIGLDWQFLNPLKEFQKSSGIIDMHYLPVFASHLAWSIYVCNFYKYFLFHLKQVETKLERFSSIFSVILCALCVLAAVVSLPIFILSIGLGGLGVALRFWLLSRGSELPANAKKHFYALAVNTLLNCIGACILGGGIFYFACRHPSGNHSMIEALLWVAGIGLTLVAHSVIIAHTTEQAATTMVGYLDRGGESSRKPKV